MAGTLATYFAKALGKQSARAALMMGGWKIAIDGNLAETLIEHGPGGVLIGADYNGNKYFEKEYAQVGRSRWVVFNDSVDYRGQDPGTIPPEWHGWLHSISDENPSNSDFVQPVYGVGARRHVTMSAERYLPKGAWSNPGKRSWQKFQAWQAPVLTAESST